MAAAGEWTPDPTQLEQICGLLAIARNPLDPGYATASATLEQHLHSPDFVVYLAWVLAYLDPGVLAEDVRQLAGLCVKQAVREYQRFAQLPADVLVFVRGAMLRALGDPSAAVRSVAGNVVTTIASRSDLLGWPELLPQLYDMTNSTDAALLEGGIKCLQHICEDSGRRLDSKQLGSPLETLVPQFLTLFQSSLESVRVCAVECLNFLLQHALNEPVILPQPMVEHLEGHVQGLSALSGDPSPKVRRVVCRGLVLLFRAFPDQLLPVIQSVSDFMLRCCCDGDARLAIVAFEYWYACCDCPLLRPDSPLDQHLQAVMPQLMPVVVRRIGYSPSEIESMLAQNEEQQAHPEGRPTDARTLFHRTKDEQAEEEDDGPLADDGEAGGEWTLRKCVANTLEVLATELGPVVILPALLPEVQARLGAEDAWAREAAILTLGTVAHGCYDGIAADMRQLFPYLLDQMNHALPQVRFIACWTLSKYLPWVVEQSAAPGGLEAVLQPVLEHLVQRVGDWHKKVQEHSCSALARLFEEAGDLVEPFLQPLLQSLGLALPRYRNKSLYVLYDTIATLAETLQASLAQPHLTPCLLHPLMANFNTVADDDRTIHPLFECLASVAAALGLAFQDYAAVCFERCCRILEANLLAHATGVVDKHGDPPDKDFMVCSLDLIAGLVGGMRGNFSALANGSNFLALLFQTLQDSSAVRQSALALCGDLTINCLDLVGPVLPELLPLVVANLQWRHRKVVSNAAWVFGTAAEHMGDELIGAHIDNALPRLVNLINSEDVHPSTCQNVALTLSILCASSTAKMAAHFPNFAASLCLSLQELVDFTDKYKAFTGLVVIAQANFEALLQCSDEFCVAVSSWQHCDPAVPPEDLRMALQQVLTAFGQRMAQQGIAAEDFYGRFDASVGQYLAQTYQLA